MKTWKILFLLFFVITFIGCQEKVLVEPNDSAAPVNDGKISIEVSNLYKTTSGADTVLTEKYLRTRYQAIAKNGITISTWQWTFAENGQKSSSPSIEFWHSLDPGAVTQVTLVGVDSDGIAHVTTVHVKIVYSLDGLPGFAFVSSTPIGNNLFNVVFVAHKKGLQGLSGNSYGYSGNVTSPAWTVKTIAPADTNSNLVNGAVVPAAVGDIGKFVVIRVALSPGDYQLPIGKVASNGNLIWGSFWGNFKDNKFTLNSSGGITGISMATVPGTFGDEGVNPIIRMDIDSTNIVLYTKYQDSFTAGFIQLQAANGVWQTALPETAVSGYANWGKIQIKFADFPMSDLLIFRFGPDISAASTFSVNMALSQYWDSAFQCLKLKTVPVLGKKKA